MGLDTPKHLTEYQKYQVEQALEVWCEKGHIEFKEVMTITDILEQYVEEVED